MGISKRLNPQNLGYILAELHMSQVDFGEVLGVTPVTVNRWMNGASPIPFYVEAWLNAAAPELLDET